MKKNGFLTFCFSFIPGIGQMYLGYMKRGVSLLTLFIAVIAFSAVTSMGVFALPAIVIYAFSFFDTWNISNKKSEDDYPHEEYIWNNSEASKIFGNVNCKKKNTIIGSTLILFGIYLIFGTILRKLSYEYNITIVYNVINQVMKYLPAILISAISIALGVKCISKR